MYREQSRCNIMLKVKNHVGALSCFDKLFAVFSLSIHSGGLIYEERLKAPKTQSWDPERTSGNVTTDRKYLKGVTRQSKDLFSLVPKA